MSMSKTVCSVIAVIVIKVCSITLFGLLVLAVVSDIDFIIITGNFCTKLMIFPMLNREYHSKDHYTGVLPHTFY